MDALFSHVIPLLGRLAVETTASQVSIVACKGKGTN